MRRRARPCPTSLGDIVRVRTKMLRNRTTVKVQPGLFLQPYIVVAAFRRGRSCEVVEGSEVTATEYALTSWLADRRRRDADRARARSRPLADDGLGDDRPPRAEEADPARPASRGRALVPARADGRRRKTNARNGRRLSAGDRSDSAAELEGDPEEILAAHAPARGRPAEAARRPRPKKKRRRGGAASSTWGGEVGSHLSAAAARAFSPSFGSELVALFLPVVGVVVVAVALPEAGLVDRRELDPAQPLGALPEVLRRDEEPHRVAVVGRQRLAVGLVDDERVARPRAPRAARSR